MMRIWLLLVVATLALTACSTNEEPQPVDPPTPTAELRVVWAGGSASPEAAKFKVLLVEPADGIADQGLVTNPALRSEVFEYRHDALEGRPAFYGGYYLDVYGSHCEPECRSGINYVKSLCAKEIYAEGGEIVTATITQRKSGSCGIRLRRSDIEQG